MVPSGKKPSETLVDDLMGYLRDNVARYAMPYEIEVREDLPRTKVGKVAYTVLEQQEARRQEALAREQEQNALLQDEEEEIAPVLSAE